MIVRLIPEGSVVGGYPIISGMDSLLVKCPDPRPRGQDRWDHRAKGTYEVLEYETGEERFKGEQCLEKL